MVFRALGGSSTLGETPGLLPPPAPPRGIWPPGTASSRTAAPLLRVCLVASESVALMLATYIFSRSRLFGGSRRSNSPVLHHGWPVCPGQISLFCGRPYTGLDPGHRGERGPHQKRCIFPREILPIASVLFAFTQSLLLALCGVPPDAHDRPRASIPRGGWRSCRRCSCRTWSSTLGLAFALAVLAGAPRVPSQTGQVFRPPTSQDPTVPQQAGRTREMAAVTGKVSICIITYNSEAHIDRCLGALERQTRPPTEVLVWDNASTDRSVALVERLGASVVRAAENVGFARAANELIRARRRRTSSCSTRMLASSPVTSRRSRGRPRPTPPSAASPASSSGPPGTGSPPARFHRPLAPPESAATNRGENEPDHGQYDTAGEVFGVCAAAALYRRAMLDDVRVDDEYFDSTFFAYYEDVDLDWRARLRGWKAHYVPTAVAEHERGHKGDERRRSTLAIRTR